MTTDKAWSISALKAYETCPRRFYEMNVLKNFKEPSSEQLAWGDAVHKALEKAVSNGDPLPIGMRQWDPIVNALKSVPGEKLTEQQLALTKKFSPTTWFGRNVWVRSIVDLAVVNGDKAVIVDYKTGKVKDDYDQLALMAAVMFHSAKEIDTITAMFIWLQEEWPDNVTKRTYTRAEIPAIWDGFLPRVEKFQEAFREKDYPARPSGLCRRFCAVTTCPYNGE